MPSRRTMTGVVQVGAPSRVRLIAAPCMRFIIASEEQLKISSSTLQETVPIFAARWAATNHAPAAGRPRAQKEGEKRASQQSASAPGATSRMPFSINAA